MTDRAEQSGKAPNDGTAIRSCLVIGGARSGKSSYAQGMAEASGAAPLYLATATVWDDEMRDRVAQHRAARDARWRTVEEPLGLPEALARFSQPGTVVVVDCLTLWLTNLMLGEHDVDAASSRLVARLAERGGPTILVSNEVGLGIVPDNALARRFRDAQGRLNQAVADVCDAVVLVTAGLPLLLKPNPQPRLTLV